MVSYYLMYLFQFYFFQICYIFKDLKRITFSVNVCKQTRLLFLILLKQYLIYCQIYAVHYLIKYFTSISFILTESQGNNFHVHMFYYSFCYIIYAYILPTFPLFFPQIFKISCVQKICQFVYIRSLYASFMCKNKNHSYSNKFVLYTYTYLEYRN